MSSQASPQLTSSYTWVVDNYSHLQEDGCYDSPYFFINELRNQFKFELNIYSDENHRGIPDSVLVYLTIIPERGHNADLTVRSRISILNAQGDKLNAQEGITKLSNGEIHSNWYYIINRRYLETQSNGLLSEGELSIHCEVQVIDPEVANVKSIYGLLPLKPLKPIASLSDDFGELLSSGKFADMVLVVGSKQFPVHNAILVARSKYFAAMFNSDTKEARENRAQIGTDASVEVFEEILHFIYSGTVNSMDKYAIVDYVRQVPIGLTTAHV